MNGWEIAGIILAVIGGLQMLSRIDDRLGDIRDLIR
jgi:hypothetical protein